MPTQHLRCALAVSAITLCLGCGTSPNPSSGRLLILGLDGLDPQTIDLLMSEGQLPNFAKLRQEGAYGRLTSQKPLLSPIIWTTIATGKGANQHGIGHFTATDTATGEEIPTSSLQRKVKALWNIASEANKKVATIGWWATWPPEEINGHVVSDHVAYHFLFDNGLFGEVEGQSSTTDDNKTHPPELFKAIQSKLRKPGDLTATELAPFVSLTDEELAQPFDFDDDIGHFRWALATAKSYRDIGLDLWRTEKPDLEMLYIEGTDSSSHLFGHLFRAEGLGGELAEQQKKFGSTTEQMYLFADELLGDVIAALDDETTLMVLSDHGFELGKLHDDPSKTRDLRRVSERFHRMEGILYLYGNRVKTNARIDGASILDIAPTALALLGLPAAQDMPGRILTEAFSQPLGSHRVVSYEGGTSNNPSRPGADTNISQAQLDHLRSLGYLSGSSGTPTAGPSGIAGSDKGDRNLAAIAFAAGDYREAAHIYRRLIEDDPDDAGLRTSLAGTLGAMGRYEDALVYLNQAIEIDPLNAEAYHNRAVVMERKGDMDSAIADYGTVLRYAPQYEASRQALIRLTGRADPRGVNTQAEAQAEALVQQASVAAQKANYQQAMALLDQAQAIAPKYALTYQYRSNVAYLKGDVPAAIAALVEGLKIEPDNALFATNLARLRSTVN